MNHMLHEAKALMKMLVSDVVCFMVQASSKEAMTSNALQFSSSFEHWMHVSSACGMKRELTALPSHEEQLPHALPASVLKLPLKSMWLRQPFPTADSKADSPHAKELALIVVIMIFSALLSFIIIIFVWDLIRF